MFDRFVLGTANFCREYNGHRVKDVGKILDYCKEVGIEWLDVATGYRTQNIGVDEWDETRNWQRILKLRQGEVSRYCSSDIVLAHDPSNPPSCKCDGESYYDLVDWKAPAFAEVPYSIADRRWENIINNSKLTRFIARSVFLKGELLKDFTPYECISFVLMNPNIYKVVIGTDSLEQLKRTLEPFEKLRDARCDDLDVIDTRRW